MNNRRDWLKPRLALIQQSIVPYDQELVITLLTCLLASTRGSLGFSTRHGRHGVVSCNGNDIERVAGVVQQTCQSVLGLSTVQVSAQDTRETFISRLFYTRSSGRYRGFSLLSDDRRENVEQASRRAQRAETRFRETYGNYPYSNTMPSPSSTTSTRHHRLTSDDAPRRQKPDFTIFEPRGWDLGKDVRTAESSDEDEHATFHDATDTLHQPTLMSAEECSKDREMPFAARQIANAIVLTGLEQCPLDVGDLLLDLLAKGELRHKNALYRPPQPFLVVAIMPRGALGDGWNVSGDVMDHFFINYTIPDGFMPTTGHSRSIPKIHLHDFKSLPPPPNMHPSVERYARAICTQVRTHAAVESGVTARCGGDLLDLVSAMAMLFQRPFITPELVAVAAPKALLHRIRVNVAMTEYLRNYFVDAEEGTEEGSIGSVHTGRTGESAPSVHTLDTSTASIVAAALDTVDPPV